MIKNEKIIKNLKIKYNENILMIREIIMHAKYVRKVWGIAVIDKYNFYHGRLVPCK